MHSVVKFIRLIYLEPHQQIETVMWSFPHSAFDWSCLLTLLSFLKPQPIVSDSWIKIKVDCGCGLDYLLPSNRKNSSSRWTSLARYLPRFIIRKMIVVLNERDQDTTKVDVRVKLAARLDSDWFFWGERSVSEWIWFFYLFVYVKVGVIVNIYLISLVSSEKRGRNRR